MTNARTLLVLVEPGARLPQSFDEERRARPEHVVVIAGGTLRVDEFAFRTLERIAGLRVSGRPVERIVLVTCQGHPHIARVLMSRALLEHLAAVDGAELVVSADCEGAAPLRHELLDLAGELMVAAGKRHLAVRVRFDRPRSDERRQQAA